MGDGTVRAETGAIAPAGEFGAGERKILEDVARGAELSAVLSSTIQLIEQQSDDMWC